MNKPLCAVWVVTYNQRDFISQTIESIVQQKTNFRFKVYIGDDCSTDGTREICIKYKNLYPELIVTLSPRNTRGVEELKPPIFTFAPNNGRSLLN